MNIPAAGSWRKPMNVTLGFQTDKPAGDYARLAGDLDRVEQKWVQAGGTEPESGRDASHFEQREQ